MKKVKILLLSILAVFMFTLTGCQVAGNECETAADCSENGEQCYAGYCGAQAPTAGFYLQFNLLDKNGSVGDADMTCDAAKVDNVSLKISTHGFVLADMADVIPCTDVNFNEVGDLPNNNNGHEVSGLWPSEEYEITVTFTNKSNESVVKTFTVIPQIAKKAEPSTSQLKNVIMEKVVEANMTISWKLNKDGDEYTTCDPALGISEFKLAMGDDVVADGDNTYEDFMTLPCSAGLSYTKKVYQVDDTNLYIYAVDATGDKLFQYEGTLKVNAGNLEAGDFTKNFTLNYVPQNKK